MKKIIICFCILLLSACSSDNTFNQREANIEVGDVVKDEPIFEYNLDDFTNTYISDDFEFSINYPRTWSVAGYKEWTGTQIMDGTLDKEEKTIEGAIDITFANTQEDFENIYEMPENYKAVNIRVYKVNSEKYDNAYNSEFLSALDYNERLNGAEVIKFQAGNKDLILYVEETPDTLEAASIINSNAFYKGKNYGYNFSLSQENYRDKENSRLIIEDYLKPMLSTFKDLSV